MLWMRKVQDGVYTVVATEEVDEKFMEAIYQAYENFYESLNPTGEVRELVGSRQSLLRLKAGGFVPLVGGLPQDQQLSPDA